MIVKMKKVTLLVSEQARLDALKKLRSLGVLHVNEIKIPAAEDIQELQRKIDEVDKTNVTLEGDADTNKSMEPEELVSKVLELTQKKDILQHELAEKEDAHSWFETWGKVSLASVKTLQEADIFLRFYSTDKDGLKRIPEEKRIVIVSENKDIIKIAFFGESEDDRLDLIEQRMPRFEVAELEERMKDIRGQLAEIDNTIAELTLYKHVLVDYRAELLKQLEFSNVLHGMGEENQFAYVQGFCPQNKLEQVKNTSDEQGWGYIIEEPDDPAQVPTLLENKKPARFLEPLLKFMGTFPGYKEVDVSFIFLVFFSVFYAMIIGDAGYGFIFLIGTIWARLKNKNAPMEPFALFYILSITTIIWGLITGTWFGSQRLAQLPFLQPFIIDTMFSFNEADEATNFMMKFTFILGLIHLVIGRLIAFKREWPSPKAFANIGWIFTLVGIFNLVRYLVLSEPMPQWAWIVLAIGFFLVALFVNFQKNVLKAFFGSLFTTILDTIGSLSDVVSYIRLFAVGIATVKVAAAFNDMAAGFLAPLILIFGHGLNIILGLMSVMVHGVRLNMLEFSGHLGQEWSGKPYDPFRE